MDVNGLFKITPGFKFKKSYSIVITVLHFTVTVGSSI